MNNYIKSINVTYRKFIFFKAVYHSVLQTVYKWWDKNTEGKGQFSIFPDIWGTSSSPVHNKHVPFMFNA